jgi:hypothetical protein
LGIGRATNAAVTKLGIESSRQTIIRFKYQSESRIVVELTNNTSANTISAKTKAAGMRQQHLSSDEIKNERSPTSLTFEILDCAKHTTGMKTARKTKYPKASGKRRPEKEWDVAERLPGFNWPVIGGLWLCKS